MKYLLPLCFLEMELRLLGWLPAGTFTHWPISCAQTGVLLAVLDLTVVQRLRQESCIHQLLGHKEDSRGGTKSKA